MNEHEDDPALLVAVQVTVVMPSEKVAPEDGEQVTLGVGVPVAVGVLKVTTAEHIPGSVDLVMLLGHAPIVGGTAQLPVTTNEPLPEALSPALSLRTACTVKELVADGVEQEVLRVSVEVFDVSDDENETELGENDAVTPVGNAVVTLRPATNAPDAGPPPGPLVMVTVYEALPGLVTGFGDCAPTVTVPTFGASVKVVVAVRPED